MKRYAVAIVFLALPMRAHADVPVVDIVAAANAARSYMQQLKDDVYQNAIVAHTLETVHEVQADVAQVTKVYEQANQIYQAASHISSVGQAYSYAMGQLGDPIPFSPYMISGLLNARTPQSAIGGLGALGTAFSTNQRLNTIYIPPDPASIDAQSLTDRITTVSAQQAISERQMTAAQERMPALQGLVDQLATTKDPADREALMIRIQGAQAQISAAQLEAQTTAQMAAAAKDAQDLRTQQKQLVSLDEFIQQGRQSVGW